MRAMRYLLLAGTAIVVLALFAPAMAAASGLLVDVDNGEKFAKDQTFQLTGPVEWSTELGDFSCGVNATFKGILADELDVTEFELIAETCEGTGIFAECAFANPEAPELPWSIDVEDADLRIAPILASFTIEECFLEGLAFEAIVNVAKGTPATGPNGGITDLALSGMGKLKAGGGELGLSIGGSLDLFGENVDTFEIEDDM